MDHLHSVEDGRAVVGDSHVTLRVLDHLVHAFRAETGADGIAEGLGCLDVRAPDFSGFAVFALHEPVSILVLDGHGRDLDIFNLYSTKFYK